MGQTLKRIAGGLVAASVAIVPTGLLAAATPAHAASMAPWTIDTDHVVLGASSTNSFKAFDGTVKSYYDGANIRGNLSGPFVGRGTLKVTWKFHDDSTSSQSDYTAGVQHDINFTSPAGKTVVRFTFTYTPNSGNVDSQTNFVGDSPKSTGSCTQLDNDGLSFGSSSSGPAFSGTVWYGGCQTNGHVYAQPSGTTTWSGTANTIEWSEFIFWYVDGSVALRSTPSVSSSRHSVTVGAESDHNKDITWVGVRTYQQQGVGGPVSSKIVKSVAFGEN